MVGIGPKAVYRGARTSLDAHQTPALPVDLTRQIHDTNLHILEAYAVWPRRTPRARGEALESLVEVFLRKFLPNRHFGLFFEMDWREVSGNFPMATTSRQWLLARPPRSRAKSVW
jgi:hypothetical protein